MTAKQAEQDVRMEVKGLMLDPSSKTPIVLLHDPVDHAYLPIRIGDIDANAIALSLEGVEPPRPMTHDLLMSSLGSLGAEVEKVTICGLQESTILAEILVKGNTGQHHLVDSRPSDAIALALRAGAPIYALREVLETARASELVSRLSDDEKVKKWLEEASDEDFGEYEM